MAEDTDRSTPLSIDEIIAEQKDKPVKPKPMIGYPIAVGNTGFSLRKQKYYRRDDDDVPDSETVGARIK